ncbi:MAG: CDP-alcohol phosphatidyltransferase family protein [Acidiferrobacterales bacterium]
MNLSQLPNAITLSRIALVPVLILAIKDRHFGTALAIFLVAGISDALDGFLAKRFSLTSRLGAILDPAADKILLVSAYVMLTLLEYIPFWLMLGVAFRDLLIVGGYLVYTSLYGPVTMRPSYLSKLNTLMQISLVCVILAQHAIALRLAGADHFLDYAVLATTVASGGHYLWTWGVVKDIAPAKTPSAPARATGERPGRGLQ